LTEGLVTALEAVGDWDIRHALAAGPPSAVAVYVIENRALRGQGYASAGAVEFRVIAFGGVVLLVSASARPAAT
jgi:hypothetical protein